MEEATRENSAFFAKDLNNKKRRDNNVKKFDEMIKKQKEEMLANRNLSPGKDCHKLTDNYAGKGKK